MRFGKLGKLLPQKFSKLKNPMINISSIMKEPFDKTRAVKVCGGIGPFQHLKI